VIQFALRCENDHRFDGWFRSADAFEALNGAGLVACAVCGSAKVEKALMAPRVQASRDKSDAPLAAPPSAAEQAIAALKKRIEKYSDYVGENFVREARDMHAGLVAERPIHGEARAEEARQLIEEGVPVVPLPFRPGRKTN